MFKQTLFFLLAIACCLSAIAQQGIHADTVQQQPATTGHLRISLLTCGAGDEVYETFGHTGVRIIDSSRTGPARDIVYNYGTFDGYDQNFEIKFMRGKLLYYVSVSTFGDFMQEYVESKRSVQENVLLLDEAQKEQINSFLATNAQLDNRYYKYDFFFDNCATRIRDIFPNTLGKGFAFAQVLPKDAHITFRDIINRYFYRKHWERVGVNILLGSKIDKVMSNTDIMFLPDYLRDGVGGATLNGQRIATDPTLILPGSKDVPAGSDDPLWLTIVIALLTVAGLSFPRLRILGRVMSSLLMLVTGLLGCFILVMWFGTDHQGCSDNLNLLWLLPTNIILAFARPKGRRRYALIGMVLIIVSFLLHIFRVQGLIIEFVPLMCALLFVYGHIYRNKNA